MVLSKLITIKSQTLDKICETLTSKYWKHSEISRLLNLHKISDEQYSHLNCKTHLYNSLADNINQSHNLTKFFNLLFDACHARNFDTQEEHQHFLEKINIILSYEGIQLKYIDGKKKITIIKPTSSVSEAKQRANKLKATLEDRNIHPQVIMFCKEEFLQENYFHAVLEACKSIYDKIRKMTGCQEDASQLVEIAFSTKKPLLAINNLSNKNEINEQIGFSNLIKGVSSMFRNTTSHAPKLYWEINFEDAVDILTMISFIHKKLDNAKSLQ